MTGYAAGSSFASVGLSHRTNEGPARKCRASARGTAHASHQTAKPRRELGNENFE